MKEETEFNTKYTR